MKVLITGGSGFIGSHLIDAYLDAGYEVISVDKKEPKIKLSNVIYIQKNILDHDLENIFKTHRPDIVNHHAASIHLLESFEQPTNYSKNNVQSTIKLLELSKIYKIKQFLFASSAAVYGEVNQFPIRESLIPNPSSFYGLDKLIGENYIRLYSDYFATTIFRYANVYGPRQTSSAEGGVVAIFTKNAINLTATTIYGDGSQTRDFVYVKDIAQASIQSTQQKISDTIHISTGIETSVIELFDQICKATHSTIPPKFKKIRDGDVLKSVMDNSKAQQILNWKPQYTLTKGLEETINYFNSN